MGRDVSSPDHITLQKRQLQAPRPLMESAHQTFIAGWQQAIWVGVAVLVVLLQAQDAEVTRKIAEMMYGTPSLRARSIEKHLQWQELLVPNIQRRLDTADGDSNAPAADAIVASAITCLDIAGQAWIREPGTDLRELYRAATRAVRA